jgi:hydrogenase expression/formation protein HypC
MCLAVPGKILSIDETNPLKMAVVDFNGVKKEICIEWLPEAKTGDYVIAHVGTALSIVDDVSARASLETFNEIEELLEQENNKSLFE